LVLLLGLVSAKTCTLRGDPHIKTFRGQKYNHYKAGWFTAARGRGFHVKVKQSFSARWRKRSIITAVRVTSKRRTLLFRVSRTRKCRKQTKRFLIPGGLVVAKVSCKHHASDHHLNVVIKLRSTTGVKGSCAGKVSKKRKKLTWKHVQSKARECGVGKKTIEESIQTLFQTSRLCFGPR